MLPSPPLDQPHQVAMASSIVANARALAKNLGEIDAQASGAVAPAGAESMWSTSGAVIRHLFGSTDLAQIARRFGRLAFECRRIVAAQPMVVHAK
jgi:hypothetical protein